MLTTHRAARSPTARPFPAHYQAHGHLYRAIVSLPPFMTASGRPLQERWVFFDCPGGINPAARLANLLALAWNTETAGWCDDGAIYNVSSAPDVIDQNVGNDDTALFECGWGGVDDVEYIDPADIDFFCTPRVRARLEAALAQIDARRIDKGAAA